MTQFNLNDKIKIIRCDLGITHPAQVNHRSIYTNQVQVITRGGGYFEGVLYFAERDSYDGQDQRRELETLLTELEGLNNTLTFPINRTPRELSTEPVYSVSINPADNRLVFIRSASDTQRLERGDYIQAGNRLYIATEKELTTQEHSSIMVNPDPNGIAPQTLLELNAPRLTARRKSGKAITVNMNGDGLLPLNLPFEENIE